MLNTGQGADAAAQASEESLVRAGAQHLEYAGLHTYFQRCQRTALVQVAADLEIADTAKEHAVGIGVSGCGILASRTKSSQPTRPSFNSAILVRPGACVEKQKSKRCKYQKSEEYIGRSNTSHSTRRLDNITGKRFADHNGHIGGPAHVTTGVVSQNVGKSG